MTQWSLTAAQKAIIEAEDQDSAFAWLLELPIPDETTPRTLRIANKKRAVNYGTDSLGAPVVWDPFPFTIAPLREDSEGTQEVYRVSLSNVSREMAALVEAFDGFEGQRATLRLVNVGILDEPRPFVELSGKVLSVTLDAQAVTLELGEPDVTRQKFPANHVSSRSCDHSYRGDRCGYTGAIVSCDKSLDGPNGCEVHENAERWGGWRGVQGGS